MSKTTQRTQRKRDAAIVSVYLSGARTVIEIAQQYGITRQRVHMIVRAAGVTIGKRKNKKRNAAIRADRATMTVAELARKYHLAYASIHHICRGIAGPRYGPRYSPVRERAMAAIAADPRKSDAWIAREIGVNQTTVWQARKRMGRTAQSDVRIGAGGRTYKLPRRHKKERAGGARTGTGPREQRGERDNDARVVSGGAAPSR